MKNEDLKIKSLLANYESGKTSLQEEELLMTYFNSAHVADELSVYQAEFNYYQAFRNIRFLGEVEVIKASFLEKMIRFFSKWYSILSVFIIVVSILVITQPEPHNNSLTSILPEEDNQTELPDVIDDAIIETKPQEAQREVQVDRSLQTEIKELPKPIQDSKPDTTPNPSNEVISEISETEIDSTIDPDTRPFAPENKEVISRGPSPDSILKGAREHAVVHRKEVSFNLTEHTTNGELSRIARLADLAGIEYFYVVDRHKKIIHELNIVMINRNNGERAQLWIAVPKKGSFAEVLIWEQDESGQVSSLPADKISHLVKAKHPIEE